MPPRSSPHRSEADNPTLLATRLPIHRTEGFGLEDGPTRTLNGGELWAESRGARYAELRLPAACGAPSTAASTAASTAGLSKAPVTGPAPAGEEAGEGARTIAVYATHLHHKDHDQVGAGPKHAWLVMCFVAARAPLCVYR